MAACRSCSPVTSAATSSARSRRSFTRAPIRILKVPHHGSATSSSQEFLEALRPDVAVISAGRGNPFGHPVASVLERYRNIGAAIYRTDQDGAVIVETDGDDGESHDVQRTEADAEDDTDGRDVEHDDTMSAMTRWRNR